MALEISNKIFGIEPPALSAASVVQYFVAYAVCHEVVSFPPVADQRWHDLLLKLESRPREFLMLRPPARAFSWTGRGARLRCEQELTEALNEMEPTATANSCRVTFQKPIGREKPPHESAALRRVSEALFDLAKTVSGFFTRREQ